MQDEIAKQRWHNLSKHDKSLNIWDDINKSEFACIKYWTWNKFGECFLPLVQNLVFLHLLSKDLKIKHTDLYFFLLFYVGMKLALLH